jgi:hypothetical protein
MSNVSTPVSPSEVAALRDLRAKRGGLHSPSARHCNRFGLQRSHAGCRHDLRSVRVSYGNVASYFAAGPTLLLNEQSFPLAVSSHNSPAKFNDSRRAHGGGVLHPFPWACVAGFRFQSDKTTLASTVAKPWLALSRSVCWLRQRLGGADNRATGCCRTSSSTTVTNRRLLEQAPGGVRGDAERSDGAKVQLCLFREP